MDQSPHFKGKETGSKRSSNLPKVSYQVGLVRHQEPVCNSHFTDRETEAENNRNSLIEAESR